MSLDVDANSIVCTKCGRAYGKRKGYFFVNYGTLYKGIGYLSVCKNCVDEIYSQYLEKCGSSKDAVRQTCRKLDLYWNEAAYEKIEKKAVTKTMMSSYLQKINNLAYVGKSYDNTLSDEGQLWKFSDIKQEENTTKDTTSEKSKVEEKEEVNIPDEVIAFWGTGYTSEMYEALEQRRKYWLSELSKDVELDAGTKALIRQICSLELDINRDRAAGRAVDKNVNALNNLLGSANLKPAQKKAESDNSALNSTPLGVWIYKFENKRPLPDKYDNSPILKYVFTWLGHVCKMLGKKNAYEKLYQEEIEKYRVEKPEYDGDDDETFMMEVMEESGENDDG